MKSKSLVIYHKSTGEKKKKKKNRSKDFSHSVGKSGTDLVFSVMFLAVHLHHPRAQDSLIDVEEAGVET